MIWQKGLKRMRIRSNNEAGRAAGGGSMRKAARRRMRGE
jgi:hypothetical protein